MKSIDTTRRDTLRMLAAMGIAAGRSGGVDALPQLGTDATNGKVVENEKVRVSRHTAAPGQPVYGMAPSPRTPQLVVFFTEANLRVAEAGKPSQVEYKAGDCWWDSGAAPLAENAGAREVTVFLVEPKAAPANVMTASERVQWKRTSVLAGGRILFENDAVRVVEHAARPRLGVCGEGMHSHPPHLTISLTGGRVKIVQPDIAPVIRDVGAGTVFWDDSGPHAVQNLGSRSTRDLLIEIKTT